MEPYLSNCLTAYRKQNSCKTTLIKLMEDWKKALDNSNVVGILSTDLSKAFDSLHPLLLLAKLKAYGFEDCAIGLMRSHFSERSNRVRTGTDTMSDWRKTERGCPQGSNLGPLMWNIFQNDLMYNIQTDECSVMMYADDHQAYTFGEESKTLRVF